MKTTLKEKSIYQFLKMNFAKKINQISQELKMRNRRNLKRIAFLKFQIQDIIIAFVVIFLKRFVALVTFYNRVDNSSLKMNVDTINQKAQNIKIFDQ